MGEVRYAAVRGLFNGDSFKQMIIMRVVDDLGYGWLRGPDVERTDGQYHDVFFPGVFEDGLREVNPGLSSQAIDVAVSTLENVDVGSLAQRNGYLAV